MDQGSHYGNRISLISKSGFRYVGILKDVDEEKQTISLVQVRSMGTEGRKGDPKEEVPPLNEIYEFVQFRATDVTSVQFESDPQASTLPQDPAISNTTQQQPAQISSQNTQVAQKKPLPDNNTPQDSKKKLPVKDDNAITKEEHFQKKYDEKQHPSSDKPVDNHHSLNQNSSHNYNGTRHDSRRARGDSHNRGHGRRYNNRNQLISVPNSDFDFQENNSKFDRSELVKEFVQLSVGRSDDLQGNDSDDHIEPNSVNKYSQNQKPLAPQNETITDSEGVVIKPEDYYNKSKSFFDDISCEIKERNSNAMSQPMRREKAKTERRHNLETFGVANSTNNYNYYRNNNRYNGRGRGGYNQGHTHRSGQNQGYYQGPRPPRNPQNSDKYENKVEQPAQAQ
ncbi:hypothetical protein BB561_000275 [Smittium simulii]|uniref:FFD box profile domain-containing protein n=1 Tax=Smittium simulii TaxID=133385 RepID=A0A2T9YZV5_9FUNG|nr:hypothetical protein BB561_000275 [Smittium simulii]